MNEDTKADERPVATRVLETFLTTFEKADGCSEAAARLHDILFSAQIPNEAALRDALFGKDAK